MRKLFGVLFQDGALFGSLPLFDNVAFPLREHTKKTEAEIRRIVLEKMEMVGLSGEEHKLPGEISGGMRKRAGLARALVLDPQIILCDEPDSGLDPVRTALLAQLLVDINAQLDATILVVTHNITLARTPAGQPRHALPPLAGHVRPARGAADQRLPGRRPVPQRPPRRPDRDVRGEGRRDESRETELGIVSTPMSSRADSLADPAQPGPAAAASALRHRQRLNQCGTPPAGDAAGDRRCVGRRTAVAGAMTIDDLLSPPPPPRTAGHRAEDHDGAPADESGPRPIPWPKQYGRTARGFRSIGGAFALALDVIRLTFRRPVQVREFIEQFWFVASVSILPAALVSIPFGAVIALQLGSLTVQIGAQSFTGAASVLAVVQQASPIVVALMIAGAAGTAICADLGARTIREEIDAMSVLGVSPVQRLIVPRVWACVLVAVLLNGMVSVVGIVGGYVFNVFAQDGTPGAYLSSFSALAQLSDLWVGEIKAVIFGFIAAVVASYRGLHPRPGRRASATR